MGFECDVAGRGRVSRRTFLRGAIGSGVAAVASAPTEAGATPSDAVWTRLDSSIAGGVIVPTDQPRFTSAKTIFNTRYDATTPAAVTTPQTPGDVARIMSFAHRHQLTVSARSGGHSYVGASAAQDTLVVDLRALTAPIGYDEARQSVTVSPATSLFDLHTSLHRSGRSIPTGTCPTVGCGGLTLGGGIGTASREFGLTCDQLTAATVVLPDGSIVSVSEGHHDDLLWMLRGGGGGTVGIVTSLTFSTQPATAKDLVLLGFPSDATSDVITRWGAWLPAVDQSNWVGVNVESDQAGDVRCAVLLACPPGSGPRLAAEFTTATGTSASFTATATLSPDEVLLRLAGGSATAPRHGFAAGSDVLASITPDVSDAIVAAVRSRSATGAAGSVIIDPIDGAVQAFRPSASAFPWRRHAAVAQWFVDVQPGESYESATSWIRDAHAAVRPSSAGAYVNYAEPGTPLRRYFGRNLARFTAIRAAYDPTRVMNASTSAAAAQTDQIARVRGG